MTQTETLGKTLTSLAQEVQVQGPKRIGILGGAFNPPHLGHLLLAEQVGKALELDEVWFMPVAKRHYEQEGTDVPVIHRLKMVQLAIQDNPFFKIQPYELLHGDKLFTVDSMRYFRRLFPDAQFYYLMGADRAQKLHKWHQIEQLAELVHFVAQKPVGTPMPETEWPVEWVEAPTLPVSSTDIRLRVFCDQSIRYQVPETVATYIEAQGLYKTAFGRV